MLRRVTLDLTGLLPTVSEIDSFVNDSSPQAFEHVVDRLLASPAYGDRWARHWLDVTYYADTTGVGRRIPLPEAWRYRDYVVKAFNDDKPYDEFVSDQIAGPAEAKHRKGGSKDVAAADDSSAAATGFLVLGPWAWFSYDRTQLRLDVADLQADLVGRTFLGLTVGCARCHDHKFDPIPNKDYYGLVGIFLSTKTLSKGNSNGGINKIQLPETLDMVQHYADGLEKWHKRVADVEVLTKENAKEQATVNKKIEGLKAQPTSDETQGQIKAAEEQLAALKKKTGTAGDRQILEFTRYSKPSLPFVTLRRTWNSPKMRGLRFAGTLTSLGNSLPEDS